MAKLDRLGWADGVAFVSHGARVGVRVSDPAVLDQLTAHFPPGSTPARSPVVDALYSLVVGSNGGSTRVRRFHLLYAGAGRVARSMELADVLAALESDIHFQVALNARRKLFVHAGVVGWHGRAIVIPGRSGSGKSSLVAALVRAGATYYSDEYAVFDAPGHVHPYGKPLSLRSAGAERPQRVTAESLGAAVGHGPLPVGLIIVTAHRAGTRWRPRRVSPAEGMLALFANTVLARIEPELALTTLRRAVAGAGALALKGARGEAEEVVGPLLELGNPNTRRSHVSRGATGEAVGA